MKAAGDAPDKIYLLRSVTKWANAANQVIGASACVQRERTSSVRKSDASRVGPRSAGICQRRTAQT